MSLGSAYRNWVGVRPIITDTVVATAVAAAATTVKVASATGITTASTIVILDGPLTESRAVTGVASTVLTVAALTNAHSQGAYVFALPTSGFGPTAYVPLKDFKVPDTYDQLYDESRVGSLAKFRGVVQGLRHAEWTFGGEVFPDTFGYVLGGILGTEVYTAGGATTPHTHAFSVKNTGTGQPVKQSFWVYDGVNCRVVVGRVTKLSLKFEPKLPVSYTSTALTRASGVLATPTPSFSAVNLLPAWRASLSIATTYVRIPMSFTVDITREEAENVPTLNGTQDPLDTLVGAVTVKVKGNFVKTGDTQQLKYLQGTVQKFVLTIAPLAATLATGTGLVFQTTLANYDKVEPMLQGKAYNTEAFQYTAIGNSTDHGASGGLSPAKVSLKNAIAGTVYL